MFLTRPTMILGAALIAGAAYAQSTPPADAPPAPGGHHRGERLAERFKAADANGDGKLTKDEAKSKMPMVYKHFDEIDVNHTGAVTMADVAGYARTHRGARKQPAATTP